MRETQQNTQWSEPCYEFTFTIFIPTYNRAHTLPRALNSIERQTFRDFEVLIIDDGSTDGTQKLVRQWQRQALFPIVYKWQENQGKNAAHNAALPRIRGRFTVILDSDDALASEALARLKHHWNAIPDAQKAQFAGVEGLCAHMDDDRIAGSRFPEDIMDSNYLDIRKKYGVTGDKKGAVRTNILREFPFPRISGEKHIRESLLWKRISQKYQFRYINEVIQLIEYQAGGLSANTFNLRMRNPQGFRFYYLEEVNIHGKNDALSKRLSSCVKYVRYSLHSGIGYIQQVRGISSPLLWLLSAPIGTLKWIVDRFKLKFSRR